MEFGRYLIEVAGTGAYRDTIVKINGKNVSRITELHLDITEEGSFLNLKINLGNFEKDSLLRFRILGEIPEQSWEDASEELIKILNFVEGKE